MEGKGHMWLEKNMEWKKEKKVFRLCFLFQALGEARGTGAQGQKLAESASCRVKMSPTQSRPRKTSVLKRCE